MALYKLQVQENEKTPQVWLDVKDNGSQVLTFTDEPTARAALAERFPVLVKMEALGVGPKRTRVVVVNPYQDIDDEKED